MQKSYVTESIYGDFELKYNYTDNTICINKYTGESPHVVIPSQIGGSRVNEIGPAAFKETGIISIEIKSSAMTVRSYAFKDCVNLREIKGNITNIDSGAFSGCINLQEITMTTCRIIARDAFRDCVNLRTVNVPQCNVSPNAFYGCTSLSSLTFQKTESLTIGGIFGVGNSDLKSLTFLKVGFDEITNEFVAFNRSIYTISLKSSCNAADNLTDNTNIGTIKRH